MARSLVLVTLTAVLLGPTAIASADTVVARRQIGLHSSPRESSKVVRRVPRGAGLEVVRREGRWLQVEVAGRRGWVTRSRVTPSRLLPEDAKATRSSANEQERARRARAKKRRARAKQRRRASEAAAEPASPQRTAASQEAGESVRPSPPRSAAGQAPEEPRARRRWSADRIRDSLEVSVIAASVHAYDDPRHRGRRIFSARSGQQLGVIGRARGGWLLVENKTGDIGWIPAAAVRDAAIDAGAAAPAATGAEDPSPPPSVEAVADAPAERSGARRVRVDLAAVGGLDSFGSRGRLQGEETLTTAQGPIIGVFGGADLGFGRWRIGGSGEYVASLTPATVTDTTADQATESAATMRRLRVGGRITYGGRARGIVRGGYYLGEVIAEPGDEGATSTASWRLGGLVAGLAGAVDAGERLTVTAGVDALLGGRRESAGAGERTIEDTRALWGSADLEFHMPAGSRAVLGYRVGYHAPTASDPERDGARQHLSHSVLLGLGYRR